MVKMNQLRAMTKIDILRALEIGLEIDYDVSQPLKLTATYKLFKDLLFQNSSLLKTKNSLKSQHHSSFL